MTFSFSVGVWWRRRLLPLVFGFGLLACLVTASPAGAVDVSQLSDFENAPCFKTLSQRNIDQKVDAPDSAMADACDATHGDADAAWARLTLLWQPRTPIDDGGSVPPLGLGGIVLALFGMGLVYAVLGMPMRAAAALMGWPSAGRDAIGIVGMVLALLLRGLFGLLIWAILGLPGATAIGGLILAGFVVMQTRSAATRPLAPSPSPSPSPAPPADTVPILPESTQPPESKEPSRRAVVLAALVNDLYAACPGLFGLVLLTWHDLRLFGVAVLLAVAVSSPLCLGWRRRLRGSFPVSVATAVLLTMMLGLATAADPWLARAFGGALRPSLIIPPLFAAAVFGMVLRRRRPVPIPGSEVSASTGH